MPQDSVTSTIAIEDPAAPDIVALLTEHLDDMHATSPAESVHALDVAALRAPHVTFFAARSGAESRRPDGEVVPAGAVLGVGALALIDSEHAELKSMRTPEWARGRGVGAAVLVAILDHARAAGLTRVSLETGSQDFFIPAHRLYESHGFVECPPFGDYVPDPHSRFYTLLLAS